MELVRGPSWVPVKLSLWFQLACIVAMMLALSFWCIVIGAAYLVDPEVGPNKIVALSLIGLIIPFGMIATLMAVPIALWARRVPTAVRLALESLPWVAISRPLMSMLPAVYHRGTADILPGRFTWLWISITLVVALIGPVTAETWMSQRDRARRISVEARAKIAQIQQEAVDRNAKLALKATEDLATAKANILKWQADTRMSPEFVQSQIAFWEAMGNIAHLRMIAKSGADHQRTAEIARALGDILKAHVGVSPEICLRRAEAVRQFINQTDWRTASSALSNDSLDPVPGDASGTAGR